ncbi:MAG: multicopper oxidase domain-containing protein, partial [Actinomycetota bacterium]
MLHAPVFFHVLRGSGTPAFDSGDLENGDTFEIAVGGSGQYGYHCQHHPEMHGTIHVAPGGLALATVGILDLPDRRFDPQTVTVQPGGRVRWEHRGSLTHTVTEDGGGLPTFCINGRAFVGNTPTILAEAGQQIRWYVFNLDLGMTWHNFHLHGQRWRFANEPIDTRSLGPAESFTLETKAPPVLLPRHARDGGEEEEEGQGGKRGKGGKHKGGKEDEDDERERGGRPRDYRVRGDFLFHCHVEMHMMGGMAGLVRSHDTLRLTPAEADRIAAETGLPLDPGNNACVAVDLDRCMAMECGQWEVVPGDPEVTMMHAVLLPNTTRVLFWGYTRADASRLWDSGPVGGFAPPANHPADVAPTPPDASFSDLWSAEHTYLDTAEGTLLIHGGLTQGERQAFLFHPATLRWELISPTTDERFYSTTLSLDDGRAMTLFGSSSKSIEIYDPATGVWSAPRATGFTEYVYYPWTYVLPDGDLFIAGPQQITRRCDWTASPFTVSLAVNTNAGGRGSNQNGTSVLLPLRPPNYEPRALIAGGNPGTILRGGVSVDRSRTVEIIDLAAAAPAWQWGPDMN